MANLHRANLLANDDGCAADFITVLKSAGRDAQRPLTKTVGRDSDSGRLKVVDSGGNVSEFARHVRPVHGPHDFADKLGLLLTAQTCAVVRDRPIAAGTVGPRRQEHFEPAAHHWLWLDVDSVQIPKDQQGEFDLTTAEGMRAAGDWLLRTYFPTEFQGVFRTFLASSSTGLRADVLKLHVGLWCERPVSADEQRQLADHLYVEHGFQVVDRALANRVQLHFTAAPIFRDVNDPLETRQVTVDGPSLVWPYLLPDASDRARELRQRHRPDDCRYGAAVADELEYDHRGLVVDGREAFLRDLAFTAVAEAREQELDLQALSRGVMAKFEELADNSRPGKRRFTERDAYDRVRSAYRKRTEGKLRRGRRAKPKDLIPLELGASDVRPKRIDDAEAETRRIIHEWIRDKLTRPKPAKPPVLAVVPSVELPPSRGQGDCVASCEIVCLKLKLHVQAVVDRLRKRARSRLGEDAERDVAVLRVSAGVGKTEQALRAYRDLVPKLDLRLFGHAAGRIVIWHLTPTLCLAEEAADRARKLGLNARTIRGRIAAAIDGEGQMCLRPKVIEEAMEHGIEDIQQTFCRRIDEQSREEVRCPHYDACPYQRQFEQPTSGAVDVVFMTHNYLTVNLGKERLPEPTFVTVDESCLDKLIALQTPRTAGELKSDVPIRWPLLGEDDLPEELGGIPLSLDDLPVFSAPYHELVDVLFRYPDGDPVPQLSREGWDWRELAAVARQLRPRPQVRPNMTDDEALQRLETIRTPALY